MATTTVSVDVQVQTKTLGELEDRLAVINKELKGLKLGEEKFKALKQEAAGLTNAIDKASKAAEGFTSAEKFQAADGAIKLLGGSLASVVGTLGVLGVESEAFGEFEKKAASAIAVAVGFKDIGEGISKIGPLLGKASAAIKGFSLTTRQAIAATGIGVFLVLLGSMIAYWDDVTKYVEKFGQKLPIVGKAINAIKNAFNDLVKRFRPVLEFFDIMPTLAEEADQRVIESNNKKIIELKREVEILQAQGAAAEKIYEKKKKLLEAELDNLKRNKADQKEIDDKAHEIKVLKEQETTRKTKEEQDKRTKDAKDAAEKRVEDEKKAQEKLKKALEKATAEYKLMLTSRATFESQILKTAEAEANIIADATKRAEALLKVEKDKLAEERILREEALGQMVDDGLLYDSDLNEQLEMLDEEFAAREIALEQQTVNTINDIRQDAYEKEKARIEKEFAEKREKLDQYSELFNNITQNIIDLSQQRYDREILNLQRERSEVENNTNLTEQQRIAALENIERKEKETEIRRIKAERDQFTLKQTLLLAEEILRTKFFVQEQLRIASLTAAEASAAASSVAIEGAKQVGKASMSLGTFVATLGPLGIAVFAASIGGIIASVISARKKAKAQIAAVEASIAGIGGGGGGVNATSIPSAPPSTQNVQERAPQALMASPMVKTYVLTGDVTSGQEAQAKLNTKRTIG